jgi:hypothetical protein
MGFTAFEETTPITVLDETQKKTLGSYPSANKTELYTGIDRQKVTKLANASHSKPYYCERLKQNVFIRKTELLK